MLEEGCDFVLKLLLSSITKSIGRDLPGYLAVITNSRGFGAQANPYRTACG
jgi:hypothetical protein